MKKANVKSLVYPELEVVVRAGALEVLVLAFFADLHGGYDVLVGIENNNDREALASALATAAKILQEGGDEPLTPMASEGSVPF